MAYCVVRTDLMSGVKQPADMVSLRFYNGSDKLAAVENGVIAKITALESHTVGSDTTYEREIWKAVAAAGTDALADCVLIASPEVMYDERKHNLDEFINEAGVAARGYRLRDRNMFSLTAEGFVVVPAIGNSVYVGAGGKLTKTQPSGASAFGKCVHIETVGSKTFYAIQIQIPDAT